MSSMQQIEVLLEGLSRDELLSLIEYIALQLRQREERIPQPLLASGKENSRRMPTSMPRWRKFGVGRGKLGGLHQRRPELWMQMHLITGAAVVVRMGPAPQAQE